MNLRKKLLLVFLIFTSLVALVGFFSTSSLVEASRDIDQIRLSSLSEVESSAEMSFELLVLDNLVKEYLSEQMDYPDEARNTREKIGVVFNRFESALKSRRQTTLEGLDLYGSDGLAEEKEELAKLTAFENGYRKVKDEIILVMARPAKKIPAGELKKYAHDWDARFKAMIDEAILFQDGAKQEIHNEALSVAKATKHSTRVVVITAVLSLLVTAFAGIYVTRSIVKPLLKLKEATQRIASGQLKIINDIQTKDEIGDLAGSFNIMTRELEKSRTQILEDQKILEHKVYARTIELEEIVRRLTETEHQLKTQANDLKNSNSELEQFAYVASHDLQEPIRTILSFVELFQTQYMGQLDAKADKYLTFILQSSRRMKVLIHDLMDFSRIGTKKELHQVNCQVILQEVRDDMQKTILETQAIIESTALPIINGYPTELKLLFQNLIANAIKFRKKDTIPRIHISATRNGTTWTFGVQDNGIGIPGEHSERVFTIFQRLHNKTEYEGSGIGLAHCRKITGLHGGEIWIDSTSGVGTTIYFTIPQIKTDEKEN